MLRRVALGALFSVAVGALSGEARAGEAWLSSGSLTPVEQRVAVAAGPTRTTLWTSLRFDATGGTMGIVVPAPPGASLDISSDAWFEALEVATAPRVFPPAGAESYCPGKSGPSNAFDTAGETAHLPSLTRPPPPLTVLADATAVSAWAAQNGQVIPAPLQNALSGITGVRYVEVAYPAPAGPAVTPTLRISMTGTPAVLPLALTSAGTANLPVTAWTIGPGQGDLIGAAQVTLSPSSLTWNAGTQASNYDTVRAAALASGPDTFLVELAGHPALVQNVSIANGTASVDGVVTTYFERAAAYGDGDFDSSTCIATATPLLDASDTVADVCPHAAYGVVPPAAPCTESPVPPQIDPGSLRCGAGADDLALALSGLSPATVWVTRHSLAIGAGTSGVDSPVGFITGTAEGPVLHASSVDYGECSDGGMSGSSSSGTTTGTGTGTGTKSSSSGTTSGGAEVIGGATGSASSATSSTAPATPRTPSTGATAPAARDPAMAPATRRAGATAAGADPAPATAAGAEERAAPAPATAAGAAPAPAAATPPAAAAAAATPGAAAAAAAASTARRPARARCAPPGSRWCWCWP